MTIKKIITDDLVATTVSESNFPVSAAAVKTVTDGKVAINQGTTHAGKALVIGSDGLVAPGTVAGQVQADWTQATTTEPDYIKNKPFNGIGNGLAVISGNLVASAQFQFKIFETLPTASETYAQTIALIETETPDTYKQYACVNKGTTEAPNWEWVEMGAGEFKVEIEQTSSGISINGTALQSADTSNTGLLTHADWANFNSKQAALTFDNEPTAGSNNPAKSGGIKTALDAKEAATNKVTAWSTTVTDAKYPSEKLVKESLDDKVDLVAGNVKIGKDDQGRYYFEE